MDGDFAAGRTGGQELIKSYSGLAAPYFGDIALLAVNGNWGSFQNIAFPNNLIGDIVNHRTGFFGKIRNVDCQKHLAALTLQNRSARGEQFCRFIVAFIGCGCAGQ